MSINRVTITGNLTRDPELKVSQSGTAILRLGVAVNDRVRNQRTGEWEDRPNFVDCTVFGNRAESLPRYLHRGMKVAIEGKLHWSQWESNGQKRSKLDVTVDELEFMTPRDGQASAPQAPQAPTYPPQAQAPQTAPQAPQQMQQAPAQQQMPVAPAPAPTMDMYDEDVPF